LKPFSAPLEDILFSLEQVASAGRIPGWDQDLTAEVLTHFAAFAEAEVAPLNEAGDRSGCRLENGRARLPAGFREAYRAYAEQGWPGLCLPEALGGQGLPATVMGAVMEIFAGANHALQMVCGLGAGAARTILAHGSEAQIQRYVPRIASGDWLATMCLTEPGAGSDLSTIRTRAHPDGPGWRIDGDKIFISGGDQDLSEGILHLVLARTGDPAEGTRGLGLFLCPSQDEAGKRNSVTVSRLEDKLGLHASPTCQLQFEDAAAELVGEPGHGLQAMFTMMNHARLDVALQGLAHAARATDVARWYAAQRVQGRGQDGSPVTIDRHAEIRRMLFEQQARTLAGRALCHLALVALDCGENRDLVDFLTPLCKVACTETGIRAADLGIQVLGGYGYLREYGLEQVWRDARVTAIYEGTNNIQSLTLAGRLLRHQDGAAATAFANWVESAGGADRNSQPGAIPELLAAWQSAASRLRAAPDPGPLAHAFTQLSISLASLVAWRLIVEARAAYRGEVDLQEVGEWAESYFTAEAHRWIEEFASGD